jgi:hypothetical protein
MIIGVQNLSTLVSGDDAYSMSLLVDRQVRDHVAPAWGIQPPVVEFYVPPQSGDAPRPHYDAIIGILDDADQAGDLGWHSEGPDADIYGRVFAQPVLANGGNALDDQLSVCSVLSHEVIEVVGDSACNRWAQQADGTLIALELCDPVEGDSYPLTITSVSGTKVTGTVSDFVLPSWFDPDAAPGQTDWLALVTAPFEVRSTGYVIVMTGGTVTEQWGEKYPEWRKATKENPTARTARRNEVYPSGLLTDPDAAGKKPPVPFRPAWAKPPTSLA